MLSRPSLKVLRQKRCRHFTTFSDKSSWHFQTFLEIIPEGYLILSNVIFNVPYQKMQPHSKGKTSTVLNPRSLQETKIFCFPDIFWDFPTIPDIFRHFTDRSRTVVWSCWRFRRGIFKCILGGRFVTGISRHTHTVLWFLGNLYYNQWFFY